MIPKDEYEKNKAYWDHQRLKEYNRELIRKEAEEFGIKSEMDIDKLFEMMWDSIEEEDYQTPTVGWQPKNLDYRIDK
jgi:hypothetical protein